MIFLRTNALLSRGLGRATVLVLLSLLLGSCVAADGDDDED
jgi:hypothetical protein